MAKLSQRIENLSQSQTLAMAQKSWELQSQGIDVVNLSIGEPNFFVPQNIKEAVKKAVDENLSFYSPVAGFTEVRKAIAEKLKNENGLDYSFDQIVISNGAKQSIANAILCLIDKGDEVLIPAPYWVSYVEMVKLAEGTCKFIKASIDNDFKVTPKQVAEAINENTKIFIFSSPSNPSGAVYSKEELKEFADIFAQHEQLVVISDEIYEKINFVGKHESIAQFENIKNRVITVNGMSKGFAMPGYRIGYIAAPKWIAKACEKLQGQYTSGANSVAQMAVIAAYHADNSFSEEMRTVFLRRRDLVVNYLKTIPGIKFNVPQGAFYFLFDISSFFGKTDGKFTIKNAGDMSYFLLNDAHVSTVSGEAFGAPECVRISYADTDEHLTEGMIRIKNALNKLK